MIPIILNTLKKLIQSPEKQSSAFYDVDLPIVLKDCSSSNSIFSLQYTLYITESYETVNYQNLTFSGSNRAQPY